MSEQTDRVLFRELTQQKMKTLVLPLTLEAYRADAAEAAVRRENPALWARIDPTAGSQTPDTPNEEPTLTKETMMTAAEVVTKYEGLVAEAMKTAPGADRLAKRQAAIARIAKKHPDLHAQYVELRTSQAGQR